MTLNSNITILEITRLDLKNENFIPPCSVSLDYILIDKRLKREFENSDIYIRVIPLLKNPSKILYYE